jgi:hypothetical protein
MLHGDGQTMGLGLITEGSGVRAVAGTMPGTYGLLPSSAYFEHIADPVATFDMSGLLSGKYATSFGEALTSFTALSNFLTDSAGLNAQAGNANNLRTPATLSSALLSKAATTHDLLDAWIPPSGITVTTIAGWGQDTVKALAYTTSSRFVCTSFCVLTPVLQHAPVTTQDGDGTVVSPSAVGNIVQGLYFDSLLFEKDGNKKIVHQNLTASTPIQKTITDLLVNKNSATEQYVVVNKPSGGTNPVKLRISSHSPVNTVVTDTSGNQSGVLPIPGTDFSGVKRDIPDSSVQVFDDEEYISVPGSGVYQVTANGYATGSATINIESVSGDMASTTAVFTHIPTTASSTVSFSIADGVSTAPVVDVNGDGAIDITVAVSSTGADPLAYVRYMRATVRSMTISKGQKHELDERLGEIERKLAPFQKKFDRKEDREKEDKEDAGSRHALNRQKLVAKLQLDTLRRYVERQVTRAAEEGRSRKRDSQASISPAHAEIILDMINQLKALL